MAGMNYSHAAVIGSGVAGAAAAFALARRGIRVSVIDDRASGRATSAGAGIVQPWATHASGPYYDLYARGADYYPTLLDRLPESAHVDFRRNGSLVVSRDESELDAVERRVRRRAESAPLVGDLTRLDNPEARELFPPLGGEYAALHIAGGARVDGRSLREALLGAASAHGARFLDAAASLDAAGTVHVDGRPLDADAVVVAAGAWTNALIEPLGVRLPVEPQRGQIVHVRIVGADTTRWPSVIPQTSHYLVSFDDSRVVVGATREAGSGFDARVTAAGQQEVLDNALDVAPGLADATVLETRVGLRPMADTPQIGELPGVPGLFVSTGFGAGGLTIGPVSGEIVADLMMGDDPEIDVSAFAPVVESVGGTA